MLPTWGEPEEDANKVMTTVAHGYRHHEHVIQNTRQLPAELSARVGLPRWEQRGDSRALSFWSIDRQGEAHGWTVERSEGGRWQVTQGS